jgi:hypothetical protein
MLFSNVPRDLLDFGVIPGGRYNDKFRQGRSEVFCLGDFSFQFNLRDLFGIPLQLALDADPMSPLPAATAVNVYPLLSLSSTAMRRRSGIVQNAFEEDAGFALKILPVLRLRDGCGSVFTHAVIR